MNKQYNALTRAVSASINHCELTHKARELIDIDLARRQHLKYEQVLTGLGCCVISLPELPAFPDAVFIEDTAIVLDEIAVIAQPGAVSRRGETPSVMTTLKHYRKLITIHPPGILEGGDVLRLGKILYVGVSSRTNQAGIMQLRAGLSPYGYSVQDMQVNGFLHLKSAVTQVSQDTVLLNPAWVDRRIFNQFQIIEVDSSESYAANALWIGESVVYPSNYPKTLDRMSQLGMHVIPVDVSELLKAEGAVTCCSIIFVEESHS